MAGISIGFAVWGSVRPEPDLWQGAESMLAESSRPVSETKQQLSLHSLSAVLMDADSGRILYGKDEHQVRPMASTTKIMTCILALELGNPEDFCEISEKAAGQPKVKLGAPAGSRIRLKDLLYSLMLESHNDSAVAIAEHISGSVEAFTEKMNRKAQDIGCVDTTFLTPNGLDAKDDAGFHHTTAADLAKIMKYCIKESLKSDEFLEITRTAQYSFSDAEGKCTYQCTNHNAFLQMMEKLGYTRAQTLALLQQKAQEE